MSSRPSTHPFLNTLSLSTPLLQHRPPSTRLQHFLFRHSPSSTLPLSQHSIFFSTPSFSALPLSAHPLPQNAPPSALLLSQYTSLRTFSTPPASALPLPAHPLPQHSAFFSTPSFSTPSSSTLRLLQHSLFQHTLSLRTPPSSALLLGKRPYAHSQHFPFFSTPFQHTLFLSTPPSLALPLL